MRPEPRWPRVLKGFAVAALIVVGFGGAYLGVKALAEAVGDAIGADGGTVAEPGLLVAVDIPSGASAVEIGELLVDAGVVESGVGFEREVATRRVSGLLKAGSYELETGMDMDALIDALIEGPGGSGVYRITVIEGLSVDQTLDSLSRQTGYALEELAGPLLDGSVVSKFVDTPAASLQAWEGLLFPDTYEVAHAAEPATILQLLADTAAERIDSVDWSVLEDRGLTAYEGVIIASMIEREVRLDEERPLVASVVFNRLDQGIPLQIDATIVYVLGGAPGGLTLDDLEIDSPYNTYQNLGLPPTPIAGPRLASLEAVAAPAETDYLYYVLIDDTGAHAFTDDFDEFLEFQQQARESGLIP
jgi:UPF0755 protein